MNSHGLAAGNESNTDLAVGLFPALSMFNHSCRPNVCFAAQGTPLARANPLAQAMRFNLFLLSIPTFLCGLSPTAFTQDPNASSDADVSSSIAVTTPHKPCFLEFQAARSICGAGQEMQVRAVREIKAGEQLFVTYINLTEDRPSRQMELLATKHFSCACERCSEPLKASPDRFLEVGPLKQHGKESPTERYIVPFIWGC